jgi:hypothetical protein
MNLQEQINRTKTLMGLQPLNEGIFKQGGKFKDLIKKIFNRGDSAEQVIEEVNPYEVKYGKDTGNSTVDGIRLNSTSNEQINNSEAKSQNIFCSIGIITDQPQPLPSDNTKQSTNIAYHVIYQNTQGSNITEYYEYFKSVYMLDGQQTDELSQMREGQNFTCSTNTLQGKTGGCSLSQELRDKILKSFESNKDFTQLKSYLDKIQ